MPIPTDRVGQFVVQFACRTPVRKELRPAERKTLENVLRDSDPELFQLFSDETARNQPFLFQAAKQHIVGAVTVTVPSFILTGDSVTLLSPVRLGGSFLPGKGDTLDTVVLNKPMADILFKVHEAIRGLRFNRAGKIFDLLLGPYTQENKGTLFKNLLANDFKLTDVGELDLTYAKFIDTQGETYNIRTVIKYQQLHLADSFQIGVRVDINNRRLRDRLDPAEVEKIWAIADREIWNHLDSIRVY